MEQHLEHVPDWRGGSRWKPLEQEHLVLLVDLVVFWRQFQYVSRFFWGVAVSLVVRPPAGFECRHESLGPQGARVAAELVFILRDGGQTRSHLLVRLQADSF